jgi:hypothetical protein
MVVSRRETCQEGGIVGMFSGEMRRSERCLSGGVFFPGEEELHAMWLRLSATMLTIKVCCMMIS